MNLANLSPGELKRDLYWHCLQCGDHEPVAPTGDGNEYVLGDKERCIKCGDGTAHVVTLQQGAAYEQGRALGMSVKEAWARAQKAVPRQSKPMPRELTREQLAYLFDVATEWPKQSELEALDVAQLVVFDKGGDKLTPAGQGLVDIALRAVNAQLRSEHG
jgi:hypothetical protein